MKLGDFPWLRSSLVLAVWLGLNVAPGACFADEIRCLNAARFLAPPDSSKPRQYAPSREMDLVHLALDVTPDFVQRTVQGRATLRFRPIAKPLRELRLDAVELKVREVTATETVQGWQTTLDQLVVTFAQPVPADREVRVTVAYQAQPAKGLYFRTPELGYPAEDTHLFTQGESIEARHWYPGFDAPNEKFTSEITCRVPEGMTVVANGRQVSEAKDPQTGLVAVTWLQDKPHANYLIALVAGYFKKLEERHGDLPLTFYTPPSMFQDAARSFAGTADMVAFFETETGVPYPWAKYAQVCVHDFVAGGMENTTLTILTDGTLFPAETENIRSSEGLVAHELSHQWFGDLVTCKDWSHLWLNEGFATYYEHLYDRHHQGRDAFLYGLYNDARGFLDHPNDVQPIVSREYDSPDERFGYLTYPKGGWVLHMLRSQLGEELYRRCIQTFLERHQFGCVVTEDLNRIIEELSGRSFDQFFDQWVYHAHHPELEISYSWDEVARLAKFNIRQVQALSDKVLLFNFPLPVRFYSQSGVRDHVLTVKEKTEDFYVPLAETPERVRLDPDYTLLAKIRFQPPTSMLNAQLADANDVIGRLLAVAQLSNRRDHEAVAKLKATLNQDPFYGVRLEASKGLRALHTDEALEALLASVTQSDARVRRQVREDLRSFYRESVLKSANQAVATEKNPDILVELVRTLGLSADAGTRDTLVRFLNSDSFRNTVADAAVNAIAALDDPTCVVPLLETLERREAVFTTGSFARGLEVLGQLTRHEEDKDRVRNCLLTRLNHPKQRVRTAAIRALGSLGDTKALPALEAQARARRESPERQAAEQAIRTVRASKKPSDEWRDLREEVLKLQQQNRDLRQEFDDLKKKLDSLPKPAPAETAKPPAKKTPPRKK